MSESASIVDMTEQAGDERVECSPDEDDGVLIEYCQKCGEDDPERDQFGLHAYCGGEIEA